MYKFDWAEVAEDDLVAAICSAAGDVPANSMAEVKVLLTRLFELAGGPPFTDKDLSGNDFNDIANGLLEDTLREAFSEDLNSLESVGFIIEKQDYGPLEYEIKIGEFVHINWCTKEQLDSLPEIGNVIAKRIIEERRYNGAFLGGSDLTERVSGLGEQSVRKLLPRLRFGRRPSKNPTPRNLEQLIKFLIQKTDKSPEESIKSILEYTISWLGAQKDIRYFADKGYNQEKPVIPHDCSMVGVLQGSEYYTWLGDTIDEASEKIDMAMFHVAMPTDEHPTHKLVDKLIAAKQRGLVVRVLLDKDREEDPYKSKIINTSALEALQAGGVDAKFDAEDQLLHSKYLVIDDELTVLGSHNWSAGSYFKYDDVSLAINSVGLARELRQRFEVLWATTN